MQVVFYDTSGRTLQTFDYSNDEGVREFTACAFNPSGDAVAFGTYNRFYVYVHNATRNVWEQVRGACEAGSGADPASRACCSTGVLDAPQILLLLRSCCSSVPDHTAAATPQQPSSYRLNTMRWNYSLIYSPLSNLMFC